ncbi:hypothetical protein AHF37_06706 [Paragonimus kellicotti]|nr:hypothetical protein AHF37_06706 [Paragonimus kellicotti]
MWFQTICDCALTYAKQLHEKLRLQGYCDEQGQFDISHPAINDLIVYLESNLETLRDHVSSRLLKRCFMELWSECLEQFLEQVHKEAEVGAGETSSSTVHGTLTVNLYIQQSQLVVEVLSASGLEPLDSNGLSDPFVVVELMPKHLFASNPKPVRTKIVKNNLDPVFNEQFEL